VRSPTDGVLHEAWGLYKAHWQHLLGIALVVFGGMAVVRALAAFVFEPQLAWLVAFVVTLLGYFLVQGALVKAVADIRDGRADLSIAGTLRAAWERIGPLATTSTLAVVAIFFGLLLLLVPGLILMTWWVVIVPAVILEDKGARAALRRSRELVRGWGWSVFGVIVITVLVLIGVSIALDVVLFPLADWLQGLVSQILVGTLTAPFAALAWTLLYYRLREAQASSAPQPPPAPDVIREGN
jgi:hypothetical protein